MTKNWVAFVSVLLLSGTVAVAGEWADKMKSVDTDGSGTVSRNEWNANAGKLKLGTAQPESRPWTGTTTTASIPANGIRRENGIGLLQVM